MRVVIDTNLLVAAFFNKKSASARILDRDIDILWTEEIRKEMEKILGNIKADKKYRDFLEKALFREENKIENPPKVRAVREDPADNKFLGCALKGKAHLIVSNDRHLLDLKEFKGMPIMRSVEALKKIKN